MNRILKNYLAVYLSNVGAIAALMIAKINHWSIGFSMYGLYLFLYLTAGVFIYLFWKNENLPKEAKFTRAILLLLFFPLAALIFVSMKIAEHRSSKIK